MLALFMNLNQIDSKAFLSKIFCVIRSLNLSFSSLLLQKFGFYTKIERKRKLRTEYGMNVIDARDRGE